MSDMKYINKYFQMHSNPSSRQPSGASALRSLHSQISNTVIDYSPWMRQQRTQKSAGTTTTATFVGILPRGFLKFVYCNKNQQFLSSLALHEERKCSARCRHIRKEPAPELVAPENPAKIQWLTLQLHSKCLNSNK
jgi:hypothetical protein